MLAVADSELKLMMGFSVLFIFALLQICTLYDGGNSEDLSNINDSSNHPHHLHPRQINLQKMFSMFSTGKDKGRSPLDINTNLEFVASKVPPKDAVKGSVNNNTFHVLGSGKCNKVKLEMIYSQEISSQGANTAERTFLVNKDNFEVLEWITWEELQNDQIPSNPVMICNKFYIIHDNNSLLQVTKDFFKKKDNTETEVLCLNNDIKEQRLQIDDYVIKEEKSSERIEVLKHFTAHNRNCDKAKHVVKLDYGNDRTKSFLKSRTHTFGGGIEGSVTGKIPELVNASGKLNLKYDYSRLNSETTSNLTKVLHSVSMEIEIPPNQSCVIEIKSKTFSARVPYSGQLTRVYNNGEERSTSINGTYEHYEIADLESLVYPCTAVTNPTKCPNT